MCKTSSDQFRVAVARVIAAQLATIGIDVHVRAFEFGTFLDDVKRGNYQLAFMQTAVITEPDYYFAYFHSSRIPTPEHRSLTNRWRYRSARVDELAERGRRLADRSARRAVYVELQQILARDVPIVPLWHEDNVAVVNANVRDYALLPTARLRGLETATKQP